MTEEYNPYAPPTYSQRRKLAFRLTKLRAFGFVLVLFAAMCLVPRDNPVAIRKNGESYRARVGEFYGFPFRVYTTIEPNYRNWHWSGFLYNAVSAGLLVFCLWRVSRVKQEES